MIYTLRSEQPLTPESARASTGKTLTEWFAALDNRGGAALGRAAIGKYLLEQNVAPWWCTTITVEYERHRGEQKKDGRYEGYAICCTKTIAAPIAQVFSAWTTAKALSTWFGASMTAEVVDAGAYRNADGDAGRFLRVRKDKDLRFTFEHPAFSAPTQVDVLFADKGKGKTGITLNHVRIQQRAEADGLRAAWSEALERLKAFCEAAPT